MKPADYYEAIHHRLDGHFTTHQLADTTRTTISVAGKALSRLGASNLVIKVGRGKWVDPQRVSRLALPEFLAGSPTYITAHTGLYHHGMIDQVPTSMDAATTGRGRTFSTPYGPVYLHQMAPALFCGWAGNRYSPQAKIATAEKSLADYFYLEFTGNPRFGKLPEVEVPSGFSWEVAHGFASLITNPSWRSFVHRRLKEQEKICLLLASIDSAEAGHQENVSKSKEKRFLC